MQKFMETWTHGNVSERSDRDLWHSKARFVFKSVWDYSQSRDMVINLTAFLILTLLNELFSAVFKLFPPSPGDRVEQQCVEVMDSMESSFISQVVYQRLKEGVSSVSVNHHELFFSVTWRNKERSDCLEPNFSPGPANGEQRKWQSEQWMASTSSQTTSLGKIRLPLRVSING